MYDIVPAQVERDAAFMADARQDVPALLTEFDRLRTIVYDVHAFLSELSNSEMADVRPDLQRVIARLSEVR
jgi:hypothetical protein